MEGTALPRYATVVGRLDRFGRNSRQRRSSPAIADFSHDEFAPSQYLRTERFQIDAARLIVASVEFRRALIQQRAKASKVFLRIMMKGRGNLYEPVQGKLHVAALHEPLLFPSFVGFKEPLLVEKVCAPRNRRIHTGFIVA